MVTKLESIDHKVLQKLLSGDHEALAVLRQQAKKAKILSRRLTDVGFYTEFSIPPDAPLIQGNPSFKLGDVNGATANVQYGLGFLLHVNNGALSMLEGYTYDERWPEHIDDLALTYSSGINRDWDNLRKTMETSHP